MIDAQGSALSRQCRSQPHYFTPGLSTTRRPRPLANFSRTTLNSKRKDLFLSVLDKPFVPKHPRRMAFCVSKKLLGSCFDFDYTFSPWNGANHGCLTACQALWMNFVVICGMSWQSASEHFGTCASVRQPSHKVAAMASFYFSLLYPLVLA
jgi:hypothetical protein